MANSPAKKAPPKDGEEKLRLIPDPKKPKKLKEGFRATGEFTEINPQEPKRK